MEPGQVITPGGPEPKDSQQNQNVGGAQPQQQTQGTPQNDSNPPTPQPTSQPEPQTPTPPPQESQPAPEQPAQEQPAENPPTNPPAPIEEAPQQEPTQQEPVQQTPQPLNPTPEQAQQATDFDNPSALMSWEASEYMDHGKTSVWYVGLGVVGLALAVFLVVVLKEWLSAAVVVLMAVAIGVYGNKKPRVLRYSLTEAGVSIGGKFYPYDDFRGYAVVQSPGLETIELDPVRRFMPRISMFFDPDRLDQIVDILDQYLPREERSADAIDRLSQKLKF